MVLPKEDGGRIQISIYMEPSTIVISVFDNGIGIPAEKISDLLNPTNDAKRGNGIVNVNKRLAKYYQTQLVIESKQGFWTKVKFEVLLQ